MKVYDGSLWLAAYASLSGVLLSANNLSDLNDAATARTNLGLSTVAQTGAYSDLSGLPALGTAAATASTDYATAAQGALADTALQSLSGESIQNLSDVGSMTPVDGDVLIWEAASSSWKSGVAAAGATGGGTDQVFYQNDQAITTDYTIPADKNAMSTGPVTINSGVTLTVSSGARYVVI